MFMCVCTMEEGTHIAWEDEGRWGIIIIIVVYYGGRDPYCTGGWGKTGYYYHYYILLEEGTCIARAKCEDGAMIYV